MVRVQSSTLKLGVPVTAFRQKPTKVSVTSCAYYAFYAPSAVGILGVGTWLDRVVPMRGQKAEERIPSTPPRSSKGLIGEPLHSHWGEEPIGPEAPTVLQTPTCAPKIRSPVRE